MGATLSNASNHDPHLHALLNLRPRAERHLYDDDAVAHLLRRNPGAAKVTYNLKRDGRGTSARYPLFRLASLGASLETIRLCYGCHAEALTRVTENRSTVLHAACGHGAKVEVVRYLCRKHPDAVRERTTHGFTPLHNACAYGSSPQVVELLARAYPEALEMKNKLGETPHMAAVNSARATEEVFSALASVGFEGGGNGKLRSELGLSSWSKLRPRRSTVTTTATTVTGDS